MELTNEFTVPVPLERAWEVLTDVELIAPCLPGAQLQEIEGDEYRGVVKVKVGPITAQYKGAATFQERDESARRLVLKAEGRDTRGQGSASALITVQMSEESGRTHVTVDTDLTIKGKVAQFGRGMIADVSGKLIDEFVDCLEGKLDAPASAGAASASGTAAASHATEPDMGDPAVTDAAASATGTEQAIGTPEGETPTPLDTTAPVAAESDSGATAMPVPDTGPATTPVAGTAGGPTTAPASGVRKIDSPEREPVDLVDAAGASVAKRVGPVVLVLFVLWLLGRRRSNHGA
jgi:carbon monoxide dehydrogenase subunit G